MGVTRVKHAEEKGKEEKGLAKDVKKPKVEMKEIIRITGTNLDGRKSLNNALLGIKGIGRMMSNSICKASGIDPNKKLSSLSEKEREKLESVIKNPISFGIPKWMVNRQKDKGTGDYLHLTGSDLDVAKKFDIQDKINIKSYQGVRHMFGMPVRGQRTRTSFRGGRAVGVVKKAIKLAMKEKEEKK